MVDTTQFAGMIGPNNLLDQVRTTAPFLFESELAASLREEHIDRLIHAGDGPHGYLRILVHGEKIKAVENPTEEEYQDYFALCIAAHHATVGTYVATDVDSKIRGHLWEGRSKESARLMFALTLQWMKWDLSRVVTPIPQYSGVGPVSGHNGEMFSVLTGALGYFIRTKDEEMIAEAEETIAQELLREKHEYDYVLKLRDHEIALCKLSSSLLHNFGDLDQGITYWGDDPKFDKWRQRFGRMGHENASSMGVSFDIAGRIYKQILAPEGHRNYPLREVRCLRRAADFLLPFGPFYDEWGETVGSSRKLTLEERAEVLSALLSGCKKIKGQVGYYRAISGVFRGFSESPDKLEKKVSSSMRGVLKDPLVKQHLLLSKGAFESSMKKRVRAILDAVKLS